MNTASKNSHTKGDSKNNPWYTMVVLGVILFIFGVYAGGGNPATLLGVSAMNDHTSLIEQSEFDIFHETWNMLESRYNFEGAPSIQERVYAATQGLTRAYNDPNTVFFPPAETESFTEDIGGEFGGVGMEVGYRSGLITIISPLRDSPAENAGIMAGDIILEVDGDDVSRSTIDDVVRRIRGEIGTDVTLGVFREGDQDIRNITITRQNITIPIIDTDYNKEDDIFTISLYSFNERAPRVFRQAMQEFRASESTNLIIDLRGNPGGYLSGAIDIASWFIPQGRIIVTESFGDEGNDPVHYRSKGYAGLPENTSVVVLINQGSASASEIVAGALSEYNVATLIGTTTFGKGSVQEYIPLSKGSSLKVTVAKWLTPDGSSFNEAGIEPDIVVEISRDDINEMSDPQLEAARQYLLDN